MIELIKITDYGLRRYIEAAYKGDEDLLKKYHVAEYTFEEAVDEEMRRINITSKGVKMSYFGVHKEEERIGYLCTFKNHLFSFCINIKHRTKEILIEFFDKIKQVLGKSFITMLYPNNTRAINWLKKCGMVEIDGVEENSITLLNIK